MPRLTLRESSVSVYDVFSRDGHLLGRVAVPPRTRIFTRDAQFAWGTQSDSTGVEHAVRFRIEPKLGER